MGQGGIFGRHDGHWASSQLGKTTKGQVNDIVALFSDPSSGYVKGFIIEGEKFTLLRVDPSENLLQGRSKSDSRSVTVMCTKKTILIAIGTPGAQGQAVSVTIGK